MVKHSGAEGVKIVKSNLIMKLLNEIVRKVGTFLANQIYIQGPL